MDLIRIKLFIELILNMHSRSLHRILPNNSERLLFFVLKVIAGICLSVFHMILNIFSDFFELFARTVLVGTHKCTISVIELLAYSFLCLAFWAVLILAAMVIVQAHV